MTSSATRYAYNLARVFALRDKLIEPLVRNFAGITLSEDDIILVAQILNRHLPSKIPETVTQACAIQLSGKQYSERDWQVFAWRVAGTVNQMRDGYIPVPWTSPGIKEWVPVQVLRVDPAATRNNEHRYRLQLRILAGTAAPLIFDKVCTTAWTSFFSRNAGFTNYKGVRPYSSVYQLSGFRFNALLDPALSRFELPAFKDLKVNASALQHNVALINMRYRNNFRCPKDLTFDCHNCAIGCQECPAATHLYTFRKLYCMQCSKQAWCDPEVSEQLCISCYRRNAVKPQT